MARSKNSPNSREGEQKYRHRTHQDNNKIIIVKRTDNVEEVKDKNHFEVK